MTIHDDLSVDAELNAYRRAVREKRFRVAAFVAVCAMLYGVWWLMKEPFGGQCHDRGDCRGDICRASSIAQTIGAVGHMHNGLCSFSCDEDSECPSGYRCEAIRARQNACVQEATAAIGEACRVGFDCHSGECIARWKDSSASIRKGEPVGTCVEEGTIARLAQERRRVLKQLRRGLRL